MDHSSLLSDCEDPLNFDFGLNSTASVSLNESSMSCCYSLGEDDSFTQAQLSSISPEEPTVSQSNESARRPLRALTKKDGSPAKKAYFRIQLIRGFKKSLRLVPKRKWPKAGVFRLEKKNQKHTELWTKYFREYKREKTYMNESVLDSINNTAEKSFANAYVAQFFGPEALRRLYFLFVELVFREDSTPQEACEKFNLWCCHETEHTQECWEVWHDVKEFAHFHLFLDLHLQPWNGSEWVSPSEPDPAQYLAGHN